MSEPLVPLDVWSDFACPWCFLASSALQQLEQSHPVQVTWHAYELRPAGSPPIPPEYLARIEANQPRLQAIAQAQYGLKLYSGPFGIDTRPAHIGMKAAEAQGKGGEYHRTVFAAYWLEGRDIGQRAVLVELAQSIGMDTDAFTAALDEPAYDNQVQADQDLARQYGLNSVPALVFAMKYLVSGAQPYAAFVQTTEQVQAELAQAAENPA